MRRGRLLAVALGCLASAGCPDAPSAEGAAAAAAVAALDSTVRAFAGLELDSPQPFHLTTTARGDLPLWVVRAPRGWEAPDGAPQLRVGVYVPYRERDGDVLVEWLRPAGDRLLCPRRSVGPRRHRLDPPQPLLVAPLAAGQRWTWEGTIDGAPAVAEFHVRHAGEVELPDGDRRRVVEVAQVTRAEGLESRRVQTWAEGRGLVREEGAFPHADGEDRVLLRLPAPGELPADSR